MEISSPLAVTDAFSMLILFLAARVATSRTIPTRSLATMVTTYRLFLDLRLPLY